MRKKKATLGGEPSGHMIFADLTTTGDGLLSALQILASMIKEGKPLSEMVREMPLYHQLDRNIPVKERKNLSSITPLQKEIADVEKKLHGKGRVILRYSGTEPVLRLMVEASSDEVAQKYADHLTHCIHEHL
jgi:phosphoglucosamine mutase